MERDKDPFFLLAENSPDAVFIGRAGRFAYLNPAAVKLFGAAAPEQLLGSPVADRVHPDFRPIVAERARRLHEQAESAPLLEEIYLRLDGSPVEVEVAAVPFRQDGQDGALVFVRDIGKRKRAEEEIRDLNRVLELRVGERTTELQSKKDQLREALALNANILRTTTAGILAYRLDGQCVLANPAAATLLGGGQEQLLQQNFRRIASWRDSGLQAAAEQVLASGRRAELEARFTSTFGREVWVDAHFSTFVSGDQVHLLLMLQDITEKKKAAAEIERLNADLERRVEERTAELALANDALLRSNLDLQHFAHVTAHDLQTPLRAIAGFAQLLRHEIAGKAGERADLWIGEVVLNTKRMHSLIEDLSSYTRLDGQSRPMEATDFRRLLDEVLATLAPLIAETGAEIACGELPTLVADRTQMAQVLQNLIDNAIKYNDSTPPRIGVTAELQDGEWTFSVADNGIGVDPKYHHRIFEIFRRLHSYREYPGNGIGLAICRRVVERHGGLIWVESQAGKGSVFHFTLPADTANP